MTKEQTTVIPEELYNLTQLAEVAAKRLSTTDEIADKDFVGQSKLVVRAVEQTLYKNSNNNIIDAEDIVTKGMKSFEEQPRLQYNHHHYQSEQIESEKIINDSSVTLTKLNYNVKSNKKMEKIPNKTASDNYNRRHNNSHLNYENYDDHQRRGGNHQYHHYPQERCNVKMLGTVYSSSDDDANYYSHKVFDRKKWRRSTVSDNSRYDEHSSCSSVPSGSSSCGSTCGDEPLYVSIHHTTIEGVGAEINGLGQVHNDSSVGSNLNLPEDEHICPECGKKYSTSSNLARHRQTHRSIMDKKAKHCPFCEKVYVSMPAFSMHVRTHNQGCECQYCGKKFSRPWLLQGHIRTHTGEKPFKCNVCTKAFADKSNLRAHIQTHSNTKPHTCKRCGKAFALKSYLYKHEESSCMKNHNKSAEKEMRSNRAISSMQITTLNYCPTSTNLPTALPLPGPESAKTTLASKLLQKEKDRREASLHNRQLPQSIATSSPSLQFIKVSTDAPLIDGTNLKSYTILNSPMMQEEYEHYKRISVIQAPSITDASPPPPLLCSGVVPTEVYPFAAANLAPTHMQVQFYNSVTKLNDDEQIQDQPMDFSPKNNFTHSSKTSPFEMTGNYAIMA